MSAEEVQNTAIVIGGSSGIGFDVVRKLSEAGFLVSYCGSNRDRVEASVQALTGGETQDSIIAAPVDVRDHDTLRTFISDVHSKWGRVSALVYSAGYSPKRDGVRIPVHETALHEWHDVFEVNLTGALIACNLLLPGMMEQHYGRIVFVGSVAARTLPRFPGAPYVASKAGLAGLCRSIATEYGRFGITCNNVSPGNVATNMTGGNQSTQNIESARRIPVGRVGMPEDFGELTAFLCTQKAAFINGATIDVTGGEYMTA